jgi:tripartite-type tricarboxylate transporter receptor subunit TctC
MLLLLLAVLTNSATIGDPAMINQEVELMKPSRRLFLPVAAGAVAAPVLFALLFAGMAAWAQTAGVVKIVVPVPPGGALDMLARLLPDQAGRPQGQTVVIENRSGANTLIGTEAVSRATPDGNTVLINAPPAFVIAPHVQKLNFDPLTSLEPVCNLVTFPLAVAVNSTSPYRTFHELLTAARARPGELTLGSVGPASLAQIAFEMLKRTAKFDMTFVPFPGTAPAVTALLGGHVQAFMGNYSDVSAQVDAGKLRALAITSRKRIALLPDVPTVAESGYADYEWEGWFAMFVPAKTPAEKTSRLADWFSAAMRVPEVKSRLATQGLYSSGLCGAEFGALIRTQHRDYGRVIREANIKGP